MNGLGSSAVGVGRHLQALAANQRRFSEQLLQLESAEVGNSAPYAQAIRMASRGSGVHELMENFGLTEVEAELLHKLHPEDDQDEPAATRRRWTTWAQLPRASPMSSMSVRM